MNGPSLSPCFQLFMHAVLIYVRLNSLTFVLSVLFILEKNESITKLKKNGQLIKYTKTSLHIHIHTFTYSVIRIEAHSVRNTETESEKDRDQGNRDSNCLSLFDLIPSSLIFSGLISRRLRCLAEKSF